MADQPPTIYADRVRERDLDNFLVEELSASVQFRDWFLSKLPPEFGCRSEGDVRLHKSPPRVQDARQTDVRIGWFKGDKLLACALIESKVTAGFQPGQAKAYRDEVKKLRSELGAGSACAVLVAPAAKLLAPDGVEHFQATISIEEMTEELRRRRTEGLASAELDARLAVRIELLRALVGKRAGSDWQPATLPSKRDFANAYAELARVMVPGLSVRPSSDGPKAITRFFDGLPLPDGFPCRVALKHEFGNGAGTKYANLQFASAAGQLDALRRRSGLLGEGIYLLASGKSLFLRIDTPALRPVGEEFEAQRENVIIGLRAVGRLAAWLDAHGVELAQILSEDGKREEPERLAAAFEEYMRSVAERAWDECRYRPSYFLDMIENRGGIGTAHKLLLGRPSDGFTKLWELKRLDLSVEAIALQEPWSGLFTDEELRTARRRLKEAGYQA